MKTFFFFTYTYARTRTGGKEAPRIEQFAFAVRNIVGHANGKYLPIEQNVVKSQQKRSLDIRSIDCHIQWWWQLEEFTRLFGESEIAMHSVFGIIFDRFGVHWLCASAHRRSGARTTTHPNEQYPSHHFELPEFRLLSHPTATTNPKVHSIDSIHRRIAKYFRRRSIQVSKLARASHSSREIEMNFFVQEIIVTRTTTVCGALIVGQQQQQRISVARIVSSSHRSIDNSVAEFVAGKIGDDHCQRIDAIRFNAFIQCNKIHSWTSKMSQSRLEVSIAIMWTCVIYLHVKMCKLQIIMISAPDGVRICILYRNQKWGNFHIAQYYYYLSLSVFSSLSIYCPLTVYCINNVIICEKNKTKPIKIDRFRSSSLPRNFHHACTNLVLISRVAAGTTAAVAKLPTSSSSSCQSNYSNTTSVGTLSLSKCKCRWVCPRRSFYLIFRPV